MNLTEYRRSADNISDKIIHYNNITDNPEGEYLEVPQTMYSDYSGTTVDRANCNTFLQRFGNIDGVCEICDSFCLSGVLIKYELYNTNEEVKELIDGLGQYPLFDDDELCRVESNIEAEAWDHWIKVDLIKELPADDNLIKDKFYEVSDEIGEYIIFETAVSCYIDLKKIAEAW